MEIKETCSDTLQLTPSAWQMLDLASLAGQRLLGFCGGEAMPSDLARRFEQAGVEVLHMYGPTEATIWATISRSQGAINERIIGSAMQNMLATTRALPTCGELATPGAELLLAGPAVARGYFKDPELTARKFSLCPEWPGQLMYATGDLVKWSEGELEYLGRIDTQVKVLGHRIELFEIEDCLSRHECVRQCAVVLHRAGLVAFVLGDRVDEVGLRKFAAEHLESYKVPEKIEHVASFPLTTSGKVDRKELQTWLSELDPDPDQRDVDYSEAWLRGVLAPLLPGLDGKEDFFRQGMRSSMVHQAVRQLQQRGLKISPHQFYRFPSCEKLAAGLRSEHPELLQLEATPSARQPVAITGMSVRAGKSGSFVALWQNLVSATDCITDFSDDELHSMGVPEEEYRSIGYVRSKGVIEDFGCFDAKFFGLSSREAQQLSPHFRCFFEDAARALKDGLPDWGPGQRTSDSVGVFAGMGDNDYLCGSFSSVEDLAIDLGNSKDFLSSQAAYLLGLSGPAVNVQTACSTGLVAVSLAASQSGCALAGGVSLSPLSPGYLAAEGLQFASSGRCRAFAADADGIVVGDVAALSLTFQIYNLTNLPTHGNVPYLTTSHFFHS